MLGFGKNIDAKATISLERTIEGALNLARRIGDRDNGMQTLITGSLHLVGGALCLLEPTASDVFLEVLGPDIV